MTGFRNNGSAEHRQCDDALKRAFGLLGKRWNGLIIAALADGPAGFMTLGRSVPGISERMLTERLRELTDTGLAVRDVKLGGPPRVRYSLTTNGEALLPVLDALADWGASCLAGHGQESRDSAAAG